MSHKDRASTCSTVPGASTCSSSSSSGSGSGSKVGRILKSDVRTDVRTDDSEKEEDSLYVGNGVIYFEAVQEEEEEEEGGERESARNQAKIVGRKGGPMGGISTSQIELSKGHADDACSLEEEQEERRQALMREVVLAQY